MKKIVIAKNCFFRMSDLRCIIGHARRPAEIALKWGAIEALPFPESELKQSIRDLELNPCGVGNFILPLSFRRKSERGKKCNNSPVAVFLTFDADNNVKLREANDFAVGGEIAVELIGSGVHGDFVRQKRFCLKRALGDFLEGLRNKFFKVHTSPKETGFIK